MRADLDARTGPATNMETAPRVPDPSRVRLTWPARAALIGVLAAFCAPLFIGLGEWDFRNDEAIYSYAVDRIIETGEWLTPRSSPDDGPFLEKPPLKFWLVAAGIELGWLPFDERGMRLWDVVFGCGAFVYVFLLGWRLAGTWAALVSVFLLFSFDPLLFEHGIRGNNMEGPLLVAYCGGIYHFVRWTDGGAQRTRRLHALAVGAYFSLGFMTKFVAVLFLPMVCVLAFALAPHTVLPLRRTWRDWLPSAALVVVVCAPWFVYQTIVTGRPFWDQIFLAHVFTRFTGTLVEGHLRPWDHYLTQLWLELRLARMALVVSLGALLLAVRAVWRRDWLSRVCLIWCLLPLALMSMGTSKLFYYVYPFFPPLALGGGLVAAAIASALERPYVRSFGERMAAGARARGFSLSSRARRVLAVIGAVALLLGFWTLVDGPVTLEVNGVRVFRNSSAVRVFVIGAIAWYMSGYGSRQLTPVAAALTLLLLPVGWYAPRVERFSSIDHPLQSVRDCAVAVQASGASPPTGFFRHSGAIHHGFTYYLRPLGPWLDVTATAAESDELPRRIGVVGAHSPVVMSTEAFLNLASGSGAAVPPAVVIGGVVVVLPGPYETCVPQAINGGATPVPAETASRPWPGRHGAEPGGVLSASGNIPQNAKRFGTWGSSEKRVAWDLAGSSRR